MKPSERAVLDQTQAFIRDTLDRAECAWMLEDQVTHTAMNEALHMALAFVDEGAPFQASLRIRDLIACFAASHRERFGL